MEGTEAHVDPGRERFAAFRAQDRAGPVLMLELVRFRDRAACPDGRAATGAEAYAASGRGSAPVFGRLGGRILWRGGFEMALIGPDSERRDAVFVAEYPPVAAFVAMLRDPDDRAAVVHRQAAVADSRLIRLSPAAAGTGFAGA